MSARQKYWWNIYHTTHQKFLWVVYYPKPYNVKVVYLQYNQHRSCQLIINSLATSNLAVCLFVTMGLFGCYSVCCICTLLRELQHHKMEVNPGTMTCLAAVWLGGLGGMCTIYLSLILTFPEEFLIRLLNSLPSMTRKSSSGFRIPHLKAMDRAVFTLSPVTIRTTIPARWHRWIASGTWKYTQTNDEYEDPVPCMPTLC